MRATANSLNPRYSEAVPQAILLSQFCTLLQLTYLSHFVLSHPPLTTNDIGAVVGIIAGKMQDFNKSLVSCGWNSGLHYEKNFFIFHFLDFCLYSRTWTCSQLDFLGFDDSFCSCDVRSLWGLWHYF